MKTRYSNLPSLSATEWSTVAAALTIGEAGVAPMLPRLARCVRMALTGRTQAAETIDARTAAIRAFVQETRRWQRPATAIVPSLLAHGFNPLQVAALAALSIH